MKVPRPAGTARNAVVAGGMVVAAGTVIAVSLAAGIGPYTALGSGDPGALVRLATPLLRLAAEAAATLCVGSLVAAAFFSGSPQTSGLVSPRGYAWLRAAGRWALAWLVIVLVLLPFDAADTGGLPVKRVLSPVAMAALVSALEGPKAWLVVALLVAVVAVGCRVALHWTSTVVLAAVAVAALLPPLVTAHASSDTGHDLASSAILLHVPAAVIWLGVLVVLARRRAWSPVLLRRYGRISAGCWLVLAVSGLVDGMVLVPAGALTTGYGLLVGAKVVLLAAVGLLGLRLRRRAAGRYGVRRLLTGELLVLATTFGISVGLTHLAPPAFVGRPVDGQQTLLGYDLAGPPTLARLAADWRIDPVFAVLVVVLAAGYLAATRRVRRGGRRWPVARTGCWLAGCTVLAVATCSGVGRYAPAMFSVHLAAHMLIGMLAPVLLALGGPLTLAGQALNASDPPGPREWLRALRTSTGVRLATHPVVAAVVFVAAPFGLYFTGLFDAAARFHWAHLAIDLVFLTIGYVFAWVAVGPDPLPRPVGMLARLGMLLAAMPADVVFGAVVINTNRILGDGAAGANMYSALDLPWVPSLAADQRLAGGLALGLAELSLLVALAALLVAWHREHTADEPAYQNLLAALRQRTGSAAVGEAAQPQAVGYHQQRRERHGPTGDQRVEQASGRDR